MPAKTDSTGAPYPGYIWNHAVHEAAEEQLLFWRLGFYPSFHPSEVVEAIEGVFAECDVKAGVLYEVFGFHDLLLRVWIPPSCSLEHFRQALLLGLDDHALKTCDAFVVNDPIRHWPFPKGSPAEEVVRRITLADTEAVAQGRLDSARAKELEEDGLLADFAAAHRRESDRWEVARKEEAGDEGALPVPPIKFAVLVAGAPDLAVDRLGRFEKTIARVLDKADRIDQQSLYSGFGSGHFLILGAAAPQNYYAIDEQLITGLNDAHIQDAYESRTYTYLSGVRSYLIFREGLSHWNGGEPTTDPEPSTLPDPHRFQLREKLGEGGFAPVYWVDDVREQRDWAMKVFSPEHAGAAEREVRALRNYDDPRIVQVYSFHEEASTGRSFLLMEYIKGQALDVRLAKGDPLSDREAVALIDNVLDALTVIHPDQVQIDELAAKKELSPDDLQRRLELQEKGLVHRDIKPGNIVLRPDGSIKLIDFNISSRPGDLVKTRSGTTRYLAPDATAGVWDVSVDLFATGVILYELICGHHPYPNDEPTADRRPTDPLNYRSDLPQGFAEFLQKACFPRARERFRNAEEMRAALHRATAELN